MTLKQSLHSIWNVAKREIHRLTSKPIYFFCMLIAPVLCVVFFLSLMQEGLPTNLPIAVVDMDGSATSRNLIRQLDAFEQTEVVYKTATFDDARREMQKGNVYGIFRFCYHDFADFGCCAGRWPGRVGRCQSAGGVRFRQSGLQKPGYEAAHGGRRHHPAGHHPDPSAERPVLR